VVAGEQPHQLPGEVVADRAVGPAELAEPEPLRHIQLGRVAPIGVQPPGLLGHVVRQVEQPLELREAAQPQTAPQRFVTEGLGRRRPLVDELGAVLQADGVHEAQERLHLLAGDGAGVGADEELADEAVLGVGDEQVGRVAVHSADLGPFEPGPADLNDPVEQPGGRIIGLSGLTGGVLSGLGRGGRRPGPAQQAVRQDLGPSGDEGIASTTAGPPAQALWSDLDELVVAGRERGHARPSTELPDLLRCAVAWVMAVDQQVEPGAEQTLQAL